jgi:hypothetical protein
VVAGRVSMIIDNTPALPHIKGGSCALGVTGSKRRAPCRGATIAEAGVPGYESLS